MVAGGLVIEHTSGVEGNIDSVGFEPGINPRPTAGSRPAERTGFPLEVDDLVGIAAETPAGTLTGLGEERLGTGDVGGAEVVVFDFVAFEGDGLVAGDGDGGCGCAAQGVDSPVAGVGADGGDDEGDCDANEPTLHLS